MARKKKGTALYELLHRDKGRSTTKDGAIKLPSWWKGGKAAPPQPADPGEPGPEPLPASRRDPGEPGPEFEPQPAPPVEETAAESETPDLDQDDLDQLPEPRFLQQQDEQEEEEEELDLEPEPAVVAAEPEPVPAGLPVPLGPRPEPVESRPTPDQPTRPYPLFGPRSPDLPGPLFRVTDGRVRVEMGQVPAMVAGGVLICLLLVSFLLGLKAGRGSGTEAPQPEAAAPKTPESPADPNAGVQSPGPRGEAPGYYRIMVQTLGHDDRAKQAALAVSRFLNDRGFAVEARQQKRRSSDGYLYYVRTTTVLDTRVEAERTQFDTLKGRIFQALKELAEQDPSLMGREPKRPEGYAQPTG